ncbi:hypothetical protein FACS189485_10520 [Spirochaetia bacterium]|nr:hypothetical protein FACS189485_10520 [Spirochaetia bacterium]
MKRNEKGNKAFGTKAVFLLGVLAAALTFGLVLMGCPTEPPDDPSNNAGLISVAGVSPGAWTGDGTIASPYQGTITVANDKATIEAADIGTASGAAAVLYYTSSYDTERTTPANITSSFPSGTTLYIKVTAEDGSTVAYYKPYVNRAPAGGLTTLAVNTWEDGNFTNTGETYAQWYEFTAPSAGTYYLWRNDSYYGSGKTARVYLYAYSSTDGYLGVVSYSTDAYNTGRLGQTLSSGDKIYIRAYASSYSGTYAVRVTDSPVAPGTPRISNITYTNPTASSSVTSPWTQVSGRWQSPTITHNETTKIRVDFDTTAANAVVIINLEVSSESGYDYAFVGYLNNTSADRTSNYYDRISGSTSKTVVISVSTAGSHFVEIGYAKDGSGNNGSDCAWFTVE